MDRKITINLPKYVIRLSLYLAEYTPNAMLIFKTLVWNLKRLNIFK